MNVFVIWATGRSLNTVVAKCKMRSVDNPGVETYDGESAEAGSSEEC